ncbi:MAG: formate dehydrogenase accessory sulfurtransferase FdhD, partial [Acidimicrobiales bacterium]
FEIVQKALRAGIAMVAGISAASNLAVGLADAEHITLVGWLRGERCTVYTHPGRILMDLGGAASDGTAVPGESSALGPCSQ